MERFLRFLVLIFLGSPSLAAKLIQDEHALIWPEHYGTEGAYFRLHHLKHKSYYFGEIFKATFLHALQFCRYHGMNLASIESDEEHDFLLKSLQNVGMLDDVMFLTSGTRISETNRFIWMSNGRLINYSKWNEAEPNNYQGKENCLVVFLSGDKLSWNDDDCEKKTHFICETVISHNCKQEGEVGQHDVSKPNRLSTISPVW